MVSLPDMGALSARAVVASAVAVSLDAEKLLHV
jgi:hypothetical protein